MKKIITIIGARPQFIKSAAVSRVLKQRQINEVIVHTGQHFDYNMSDVFFKEMHIPQPNYNLGIAGMSHGAMTGQMMEKIEAVLLKERPELVVVYGDTNSTIAGALAAKKIHVPVAHVEAGLRSFNMQMPEEINRILTDRISDFLFCPTKTAVNNLRKEGFENFSCKIENTGDVMYDAALFYEKFAAEKSTIIKQKALPKGEFVLCTLHRQENTDKTENLKAILEAFEEINASFPIVLPLHPRTKKIIQKLQLKTSLNIIDPVGYFDMIELLKHSKLVITDSGGLQKEAFFFKKFCITTREETEWVELVENGYNFLSGADKDKILAHFIKAQHEHNNFSIALYGNGNASEKIVDSLLTAI